MNGWNRYLIFGLLILGMAGCKKIEDDAKVKPNEKPNIIPREGDLSAGAGGVMAARQAAGRTANLVDLNSMYQSILAWILERNSAPDAKDIKGWIQKENPKFAALIDQGVVVLTDCKDKENGIFAYTISPQKGGEHYYVTPKGVLLAKPDELKTMLDEQKKPFIPPPKK